MKLLKAIAQLLKSLGGRKQVMECPYCSKGEYDKCPEAREIMEMAPPRQGSVGEITVDK